MQTLWNLGVLLRARLLWGCWLLLLPVMSCTGSIEGPPGSGGGGPMQNAPGANGLTCQAGLSACGAACVNLQADSGNCGSCGSTCTAPSVCANGSCDTACAAGFEKCGTSCVSLSADAANCGGCGKACDAGVPCFAGACGCPEGVLLCQGQCFDPKTDAQHCGSCDTACSGGASCVGGACSCAADEQLCGSECSNLNTPKHCGACGKSCNAGEVCAAGTCIPGSQPCPSGLTRCGDSCVDLQTASSTCGACENKCAGGQACTGGQCACPAGKTSCGTSCVDLPTSTLHCGQCGNACTAGQTCQSGQCKCAQATDIVCNNVCVNGSTDAANCGACGVACTDGLPCTNGKCACPDGEIVCGGKCVSTDSSAEHCGACGMACPEGESCLAGKCSGAIGDACSSTLAKGITIREIAVYQAGKVPVMKNGEQVLANARPAEIVQGKMARVRVFVDLDAGWSARTVSARLLLTNGDAMPSYFAKRSVTQASTENSFATTFNIDVKAEDITDTTRYAIELVECDGATTGAAGRARFPSVDKVELVTRKTGTIKLRFIPFNANGRTAASDTARLDAYRDYIARMYPTSGVEYTVGTPFTVSGTISPDGRGWSDALDQLSSLHERDNAANDVYYYGLFQPGDSINQYCGGGCVAGIGYVTVAQTFSRHQRVALGLSYGTLASAETFAHELGHNHGRPHSPCGGADDSDRNYPHAGAKIGWWGFEAPDKLKDPASDTDIMGYCRNQWVSDYTYGLFADRIAVLNGATRELPPPGEMQRFRFLLTDFAGPRWGVQREAPRYPTGEPEAANILDATGGVIATVTVYRTSTDHLGGALLLVPEPEAGWHAVQIAGEVPLSFTSTNGSQP
jgi:Peptidase M66/Stigma-specific protein, Stig1